jgi:putative two-component system response regulator
MSDVRIPRVLIVEDDPMVLGTLDRMIQRSGYQTTLTADPDQARTLMRSSVFDIVVTDLNLPMADGRIFAATICGQCPQPVVVITGTDDVRAVTRLLGGKAPNAFLSKPFDGAELVSILAGVLRGVAAKHDGDRNLTCELAEGMARALALRDVETHAHAQRVALWTHRLAGEVGMTGDDRFWAQIGGLLHDVGKIGVPDGILNKPGKLDDAEWEIMHRHPALGAELLAPVSRLAPAHDLVLHHHESWNGTGYPDRLAGEAIPLAARIFAPIDAYDAMTSDRPYRRAMSHVEAIARIVEMRGIQFDPNVVDALLRIDTDEWVGVRAHVADGTAALIRDDVP